MITAEAGASRREERSSVANMRSSREGEHVTRAEKRFSDVKVRSLDVRVRLSGPATPAQMRSQGLTRKSSESFENTFSKSRATTA